jgi:ZIP family zinc transporter
MASLWPLLLGVAAFLAILGAGLLVPAGGPWLHRVSAFAAGVLIAVALFDLLPEAMTLAAARSMPPILVTYPLALGFLLLFFVDRYISVERVCEAGLCRNLRHVRGSWFGAGEIIAHSFLDGFAIGVGFQFSAQMGVIIAAAVVSHSFTHGINTVTLMLRAGNSLRTTRLMLLVNAVAPVLGVLAGTVMTIPPELLSMVLAFFAGGFVYLGASNLLPEAHEHNPPLITLLCTLAGFGVILLITRLLHVGF